MYFRDLFRLKSIFSRQGNLGAITFREGYEDARTWNTPEREHNEVNGRYRWLTVAILFTEAILCWKYRKDTGHINEDAETPFYIWFPWVAAYVSMGLFWIYLRFKPGHTIKYPVSASSSRTRRRSPSPTRRRKTIK